MSYQVLARKWRSRNFEELVGQTHVRRALVNALKEDRLHHAYLFTGTRGVGKTTIARIFAKCLNCDTGVTATPCGECESCKAIDEGRFVDLIEVDAASRTKVEDTRELLDNVQYAPTRGRFKVYLIDEVHMLSGHSFNALLKTLEEPPPHVKFLLATTDPQKLPVTVLSRCLQFNLKRMAPQMIVDHLQHILAEEEIEYELPALNMIARAADGSMRDGLSLLDQAIAFCGGKVKTDEVSEMLGTVSREHLYRIAEALIAQNPGQVMSVVAELAEQPPDFEDVLADLITLMHQIALMQTVPEALDLPDEDRARLNTLANGIHPEDLQLFYQIALQGRKDMSVAPDLKDAFEMVLLRMLVFRPAGDAELAAPATQGTPQAAASPEPVESSPIPREAVSQPQAKTASKAEPAPAPEQKPVATTQAPEPAGVAHSIEELKDWVTLLPNLGLSAMVKELANNCFVESWDESQVILGIDKSKEYLATDKSREKIAQCMSDYFGQNLSVRIQASEAQVETPAMSREKAAEEKQKAAESSVEHDDFIQAMQDAFDAEVVPGTVKPNS
jgi:DNA polymerase-3 subunit gamma/tau